MADVNAISTAAPVRYPTPAEQLAQARSVVQRYEAKYGISSEEAFDTMRRSANTPNITTWRNAYRTMQALERQIDG